MLDYWLAHSEGFRIRGRRGSGVVETVFVSPHGRVTALEVRGRLVRRRRVIPAASVHEVVPADQLLVASRPLRARTRTSIAVAFRAARPGARRLGALALRGARAAYPAARGLARLALRAVRADADLLHRCSIVAFHGARRFAVAVDGDARRLWVAKTKLAGARAGTTISRSYARASAGASVARTAVLARARAGSRSSSASSSWLPARPPRSSERQPPRV